MIGLAAGTDKIITKPLFTNKKKIDIPMNNEVNDCLLVVTKLWMSEKFLFLVSISTKNKCRKKNRFL